MLTIFFLSFCNAFEVIVFYILLVIFDEFEFGIYYFIYVPEGGQARVEIGKYFGIVFPILKNECYII